ncbi:hypothetical protein F5X97DRAFT_320469 [Nemania serpens]|nr:hypothetical protein F5X97DRAFT_320469 [Nemania serpens]
MITPSYGSMQTDPKDMGPGISRMETVAMDQASHRLQKHRRRHGVDAERVRVQHARPRRIFFGWSEGALDCPGKRFSQVEFVATIATLFLHWRVEPVTEEGETLHEARERVKNLIKTDSAFVLLLQMVHPERAPLVWQKR